MRRYFDVFRCRKGGAAIEYALVATLIAIAALGAFHNLHNSIDNKYTSVSTAMDSAS